MPLVPEGCVQVNEGPFIAFAQVSALPHYWSPCSLAFWCFISVRQALPPRSLFITVEHRLLNPDTREPSISSAPFSTPSTSVSKLFQSFHLCQKCQHRWQQLLVVVMVTTTDFYWPLTIYIYNWYSYISDISLIYMHVTGIRSLTYIIVTSVLF